MVGAMPQSADSASSGRRKRIAYILVAIVAVAAFIAVVATAQMSSGDKTVSEGDGSQQQDAAPPASDPADQGEGGADDAQGEGPWIKRDADDAAAIGDVDAPVVITEWTDPRCPFCAHFHNAILPELKKDYVDSGKVRFEFKTVAFFGEQSVAAGAAMEAAGRQGKYTEYSDALYGAAPEKGHPDLPDDKLVGFAEEAGVEDIDKFKKDMKDPDLLDAVAGATAEAQQYYGIQAVPFFAASDGESSLRGAQPAENFKAFIDDQLEKAEGK